MARTFTLTLALLAACAPDDAVDPFDPAFDGADDFDVERPSILPDDAVQLSPDLYYLGEAFDLDGTRIQGFAWVDREAKGDRGKPGGGGGTSSCYALIVPNGLSAVEPWGIGDISTSGLSLADVRAELERSMGDWEASAGAPIFGDYDASSSGVVDLTAVDGENNVIFGDAGGGSIVAVTYSWGVFYGPPKSRYLAEWDQIYGDYYPWASDGGATTGAFDFGNVAEHELGHAAGMDHPDNSCTEETMYAYVDYGETKKRTLNAGDIAGIKKLGY